MNLKRSVLVLVLFGGFAVLICAAAGRQTSLDKVRAYYFGNSLTGCTMPMLHEALGAGAGREWEVSESRGPGWPLWTHLQNRPQQVEKLTTGDYDAVVLQPFGGAGLTRIVTEMWQGKVKFDEPTDVGDIHSASVFVEKLLAGNPQGHVFIYADWPGIPGVRELQRKIQREEGERRDPTHEEMIPYRQSFDYESQWLAKYDPADPRSAGNNRDYQYTLFEALKSRFPRLWLDGRLRMIPVGDVFYALDRKMRDGLVPGLANIGEFYADGLHIRIGLPRYTLAATFYAVMFRDRPHNLDWRLFDEPENFKMENLPWGYIHEPDFGVHVKIGPERAKVVNDTIREVVAGHPYTRIPEQAAEAQ